MKKEVMAGIEAEGIIKREKLMWYKKKLAAFTGELILTKEKLHFIQDANPLVGVLVQLLIKKQGQHEAWTIPVADITDVTHEAYGMNKHITSIKHGGTATNVLAKSTDDWKAAIMGLK